MLSRLPVLFLIAAVGTLSLVAPVGATFVDLWGLTLTGVDQGYNLSATVAFQRDGDFLRVILENSATQDVTLQRHIINALFFDLVGGGTLTPLNAAIPTGGQLWFPTGPGSAPVNGPVDVGGRWDFRDDITTAPGGRAYGIGAAGYTIFGQGAFGAGPYYNVNGVDYGITAAGDNATTGQVAVTGGSAQNPIPLAYHRTYFDFAGLNSFGDDFAISRPAVQYGTALTPTDPIVQTAEPATLLFLGTGLIAVAGIAARRRKRS